MSATLSALLALSCCGAKYTPVVDPTADGPPEFVVDVNQIPNPIPKLEPLSRYGNHSPYHVRGKTYHVMPTSHNFIQRGVASWYGTKFHKQKTSSGERYNMFAMTAAHKNLPLPTYVRVTNLENKRSVIVKVNDRGPFHDDRIIDLSYSAAKKLGILARGTGYVEIEAIDPIRPSYFVENDRDFKKPKLYLQVGTFKKRHIALNFASKLQDYIKESPIYISSNPHNAKTLYKVLIGPFIGSKQFVSMRNKFQYAGIGQPIPVLR